MSSAEILNDAARLIRQMERFRQLMVVMAEIGMFLAAGTLAFLLRFDLSIPPTRLKFLYWGLAVWIPVKLVTFRVEGLDRGWNRFVSIQDLVQIMVGNLAGSALSAALILLLVPRGFPRSIYLIDLLLCFIATAGMRAAIRI